MTAEEHRTAQSEQPSGHSDQATYAFGDIELAALRLQLIDRVFAEPSRSLLDVPAVDRPQLAVDLGCGPGFSTRLVGERLRPLRLAGLDTSESFLERAKAAGPPAQWFAHDVTSVPFPTGPADLLHARFVLTHLAEPESVLLSWLDNLNPGGYLLTQDDEEITAGHPVLAAYEEMARALVAHRGGDLWVGARLARLEPPGGFERVVSRVYPHHIPTSLAAQLFAMNFAVWRHDPIIVETHSDSVLDQMATELTRLGSADDPSDVVFDIRQLAFRRR